MKRHVVALLALLTLAGCPRDPERGPYVYAIQAGDRAVVKLGYSTDVSRRLETLQTANADELHVLAVVHGTTRDEADLHARFRRLRVRGEWYRLEGDVATCVREMAKTRRVCP